MNSLDIQKEKEFHVDDNSSSSSSIIKLNNDDYLKLVSAKLVLDVINKSVKTIKQTNPDNDESIQSDPLNNTNQKNSFNQVKLKKYFGTKRWNCISRPQYKYSCGISSLVSCWNYLYSTIGYGKLKPLSQEEAMTILGFSEPFDDIRFGPFTGNRTLMKWFNKLNDHFSVDGKASFFYKPVGTNKTFGISGDMAKERLFNLMNTRNVAFIYHCYNHYCCPIGYEREPIDRTKIYLEEEEEEFDKQDYVDWVLLADTSRKYPSFHVVKWEDIDKDLNTKSPQYLNIRNLDKGVQTREKTDQITGEIQKSKSEKNLHCILKFESFNSNEQTNFSIDLNLVELTRSSQNELDELSDEIEDDLND